jgi:anti-sigma factor RsiW
VALHGVPQGRSTAERNVFTDLQLQDQIDGRLKSVIAPAVAACLLAHPRVAADVEAVRRQSDALQALGQEILDEPVPEQLCRILREMRLADLSDDQLCRGKRPVEPRSGNGRRRHFAFYSKSSGPS